MNGNVSASPIPDRGAIHVPHDFAGPPYILERPGGTYIVTKDRRHHPPAESHA